MRSVTKEQFFQRVLAETGRLPYFGGSGIGLLPALYQMTGPWCAAVCVDEPASPVAAWLRSNTDAQLHFFPKPPQAGGAPPPTMAQGPWDAGTMPVVLGESERDLLSAATIAFGYGTKPARYRQRPLDRLFGDGHLLGFIHIGSMRDAAPIARGARRLLERFGPAVLITRDAPSGKGAGIPELSALAEVFSDAGYVLHDAMLNPCSTAEEIAMALDGWQESAFFGLPERYDIGRLLQCFWADLASYRSRPDPGIRIRAEELADCTGFYPVEQWGELHWRWTGPLPRASLRVPLGRPGHYRLRCQLLKVATDQVLDTLRLFVNGTVFPHTVQYNEHDLGLEAGLTVSLSRFSPTAEVRFVHSETYSVNPDDPRRLGLALMEVQLERQE